MEQLKGKIGGVNRLGTTSDMTLRLALRRFGIDPEKETKIIATGENPQRLAALVATTSRSLLSSASRWCAKPRRWAFAT